MPREHEQSKALIWSDKQLPCLNDKTDPRQKRSAHSLGFLQLMLTNSLFSGSWPV